MQALLGWHAVLVGTTERRAHKGLDATHHHLGDEQLERALGGDVPRDCAEVAHVDAVLVQLFDQVPVRYALVAIDQGREARNDARVQVIGGLAHLVDAGVSRERALHARDGVGRERSSVVCDELGPQTEAQGDLVVLRTDARALGRIETREIDEVVALVLTEVALHVTRAVQLDLARRGAVVAALDHPVLLEIESLGQDRHVALEHRVVVHRAAAIERAVPNGVGVDGQARLRRQSIATVVDQGHERHVQLRNVGLRDADRALELVVDALHREAVVRFASAVHPHVVL